MTADYDRKTHQDDGDSDSLVRVVLGSVCDQWKIFLYGLYVGFGVFFASCSVLMGDAVSRTVAAVLTLYGYDPHVAGIGFVWGPIPTVLEIPFVAFFQQWPSLLSLGLAGTFVTAGFGVYGVSSLNRALLHREVRTSWRRVLVFAFALNPFVIIFSSNGMSEMPYIALLMGAVGALAVWVDTQKNSRLAIAGCLLGVACWVRYEPVAAAMGAALLVGVVVWLRSREKRFLHAAGAVMMLLAPVVTCFLMFVGMSWWLTGVAFAQFSSSYGNAAITTAVGVSTYANVVVPQIAQELLAMSPFLLVLLPLAVWQLRVRDGGRRLTLGVLGTAVFLPPLAFDVVELSTGTLLTLIRYLIAAVPLTVYLVAGFLERGRPLHAWRSGVRGFIVGVLVLGVTSITWATNFAITGSKPLASQEYAYHQAVLGKPSAPYSDYQPQAAKSVAQWLDAQHLKKATIITDTFLGFMVISQSRYPNRYVVPPVQNYSAILSNPSRYGVVYMIAVPSDGTGALYAPNAYYPGLYSGCVKNTSLSLSVTGTGTPTQWRLYKLTGPVSSANASYGPHCVVHRVVLGGYSSIGRQ